MENSTDQAQECAHCHQPIITKITNNKGENFCCFGCMTVADLLSNQTEAEMLSQIDDTPYRYLNNEKIKHALLQFQHDTLEKIAIHLPQIHCSSCIYLLENLVSLAEGILEVKVQFTRKEAHITYKADTISLSKIAALLNHIGYAPDFQTKLKSGTAPKKRLLFQLGVAGFFFGNTMLLALPEYFDANFNLHADLQIFFRYLTLLFALPVLTYSARDYFTNSYKTLRAGILSIDLPIALGISVLFLRSTYEVLSGTGSGFFDSLSGLVFFLLLGKWFQQKTYENFSFDRDVRSFLPLAANLFKGDIEVPIPIDDLKKGDIVVLRQGEVLPADAILESDTAELDYSYISGESMPVKQHKGDHLYAGAKLIDGARYFRISKSVDGSYLSSLWAKDAFHESDHKKSISLSDRISQYFTPAILFIAIAGASVWYFINPDKAATVFTAILIVACPCALALAEPFAQGSLMRSFGRLGFFLKNAFVLQRLRHVNHIVFDKTGTLTQSGGIEVQWHGNKLSEDEKRAIIAIANQAQHPLAKPVSAFLEIDTDEIHAPLTFREATGEGVWATYNKDEYKIGKASFTGNNEVADTTSIYVLKNNTLLGYFALYQPLRENLTEVLQHIPADVKFSVLSGDNDAEKQRFNRVFNGRADLHFNCSPHQKLGLIKQFQDQGDYVLMLGDGLNDAGALQQAQVGISICEEKINYFPASDALLTAKSFGKLGTFLAWSHRNKKTIYQAFTLSLIYNVLGLSFALAGVLSPLVCAILMPVSSISVVIFTTLKNRMS